MGKSKYSLDCEESYFTVEYKDVMSLSLDLSFFHYCCQNGKVICLNECEQRFEISPYCNQIIPSKRNLVMLTTCSTFSVAQYKFINITKIFFE